VVNPLFITNDSASRDWRTAAKLGAKKCCPSNARKLIGAGAPALERRGFDSVHTPANAKMMTN